MLRARGLMAAMLVVGVLPGTLLAQPISRQQITDLEQQAVGQPADAFQGMQTLWLQSSPQGPEHWRLTLTMAYLAARLGMKDSMARYAQALVTEASATMRSDLEQAARCIEARQKIGEGHFAQARLLLEPPLASLPKSADMWIVYYCHISYAAALEPMGDLKASLASAQRALAAADAASVAPWQIDSRLTLAYSLIRAGHHQQTMALIDEAQAIAERHQDAASLGSIHTMRAIAVAHEPGSLPRQRQEHEKAAEQWRKAGAQRPLVTAYTNLSDMALQTESYAQARRWAQEAIRLGRAQRMPESELYVARINDGLAMIGMGDREGGMAAVMEVVALEEQAGDLVSAAAQLHEVGKLLEARGEWREAYSALARRRALAAKMSTQEQRLALVTIEEELAAQQRKLQAEALRAEGDLAQAKLQLESLRFRSWALTAAILLIAAFWAARQWWRAQRAEQAQRRALNQVQEQAQTDSLTGIFNRRAATARLDQAQRGDGALYMLDIDHFKRVNDRHGHAAGDELLVEFAQRLSASVRAGDMVARWGGEEFLVWLPAAHPGMADAFAQRLLEVVGTQPFHIRDVALNITASIGYACLPLTWVGTPLAWSTTLELLDAALYRAKTAGRHRAVGIHSLQGFAGMHWKSLMEQMGTGQVLTSAELREWVGPQPAVEESS